MVQTNDNPYLRNITANGGIVALPISGLGNIGVFPVLTGVTSANFTFEASINSTDGVNGNWFAISGQRTNLAALESTSGALSATPAYGWCFDVLCFNYFRIRATAGTFGTAGFYMLPGEGPKVLGPMPALAQLVTLTGGSVVGFAARNSATPGNPLYIATGRSTNLAGITDGRNVDLFADLQGKTINKPYAPGELDWQATMAADGGTITTTAVTTLRAAVATYRNYVTAIQLHNSSAVATEVVLQDSTGTPVVLWRGYMPANMTVPRDIIFPTPLKTTAVTSAVNLRCVTTGAAIWWAVQGYVGP